MFMHIVKKEYCVFNTFEMVLRGKVLLKLRFCNAKALLDLVFVCHLLEKEKRDNITRRLHSKIKRQGEPGAG